MEKCQNHVNKKVKQTYPILVWDDLEEKQVSIIIILSMQLVIVIWKNTRSILWCRFSYLKLFLFGRWEGNDVSLRTQSDVEFLLLNYRCVSFVYPLLRDKSIFQCKLTFFWYWCNIHSLLAPQSSAHIIAPHRDPTQSQPDPTYSFGAHLPIYMVNGKSVKHCDSLIQ